MRIGITAREVEFFVNLYDPFHPDYRQIRQIRKNRLTLPRRLPMKFRAMPREVQIFSGIGIPFRK